MSDEQIKQSMESHYLNSWQLLEDTESFNDFIDGIRLRMCTDTKYQPLLDELFEEFEDVLNENEQLKMEL